jgi:hypothetical protein
MPNLKTCFCHSCGKFMDCPYQSNIDSELYHKVCLPETEAFRFETEAGQVVEMRKVYLDKFQNRLNQEWRNPND